MTGSLSQALIMGGRAEAEGSLFEVCGEKHQREKGEASRRGETQEGPPSATAHLDLPVSTLPCPSRQLPSTQLLRTGQRSGHLVTSLELRLPRIPAAFSASPGAGQASGLRDCLAWGGAVFPSGSCSYPLPVSPEICPGISQLPLLGS